ncbi:MAG: peptidoglycan DD-metalloendopeptidase family protein [Magnetococcales bacterium]|nr:peptidoglycan DD-metalloendopeptidase family protein [Magnetococcales bacterium]
MRPIPEKTTPGKALFFGLGLLLAAMPGFQALASPESQLQLQRHRLKLNQTLKSLRNEARELQEHQGLEQGLLGELELLDQQLLDLATQKENLAAQVQTAREELPQLAEKIDSLTAEQKKIKADLALHLRLMYHLGGQGILKIVLSQENFSQARQGFLYHGRMIQARNKQFQQYTENLEKLRQITENHKALLARTQTLADALAVRMVELDNKKQERSRLLAGIREKKNLHQQKVMELQRARGILGAFVDKLHDALDDPSPVATEEKEPPRENRRHSQPAASTAPADDHAATRQEFERISQKKGQLPPPVKDRPGQNRPPGLFYPVESDTAIRAVYRGQVVYADWFRGYGLLIILNHGDHVYSLYGHNRKLLVAPGDWVEAQEKIAESGDTGSLEGISGLYFEIRDKGRSVNPRVWLGS